MSRVVRSRSTFLLLIQSVFIKGFVLLVAETFVFFHLVVRFALSEELSMDWFLSLFVIGKRRVTGLFSSKDFSCSRLCKS
jgi:hypothetical protein